MVGSQLQQEINTFVQEVGEPSGIIVDISSPVIDARVQSHYLPISHAQNERIKRQALSALRDGWHENQDHQHSRRWGRTSINISIFCLLPTSVDEIGTPNMPAAIYAVVRFSGWYYTNSNLWRRFRPYAQEVVHSLWGDIEHW